MGLEVFVVLLLTCVQTDAGRLKVSGNHFVMNGRRVFLSGVNLAWAKYGQDFGNDHYRFRKPELENYLKEVHAAGGNSLRVWLNYQGENTPKFDSNGYVTGLDHTGNFLSDVKDFLDMAYKYNILIFFNLWNGAVKDSKEFRLDGLIRDTHKLQSWLDHGLIPLVKATKDKPALGGWEVFNEPEGLIIPDRVSSELCYDTRSYHNAAAGWAGKLYHYEEILRFLNWQTDAIRRTDPQALVTVGAWKPQAITDQYSMHNHYSDHCLVKAGGKSLGVFQYYHVHTYDWNGHFETLTPFKHPASDYMLSKPLIIGEFSSKRGGGMTSTEMYQYAYDNGYSGAWTWSLTGHSAADPWDVMKVGLESLRNKQDSNKDFVNIKL